MTKENRNHANKQNTDDMTAYIKRLSGKLSHLFRSSTHDTVSERKSK